MNDPTILQGADPAHRSPLTIKALLLGDRLDTAGLERKDMIAATPFAFRMGPRAVSCLKESTGIPESPSF